MIVKSTLALVMIAVFSSPSLAVAGDDEDKKSEASPDRRSDELNRIRKLELEIEQLKAALPTRLTLEEQEKKDVDKEAPKEAGELELKASFTDGFHLKTTDGKFDLHIGGRWLEEYRYTFNRPVNGGGLRTSTNSFYIREAFISLDGTLYKDWGFKFNGDLAPTAGAVAEEA
jgi:hypothetical protein